MDSSVLPDPDTPLSSSASAATLRDNQHQQQRPSSSQRRSSVLALDRSPRTPPSPRPRECPFNRQNRRLQLRMLVFAAASSFLPFDRKALNFATWRSFFRELQSAPEEKKQVSLQEIGKFYPNGGASHSSRGPLPSLPLFGWNWRKEESGSSSEVPFPPRFPFRITPRAKRTTPCLEAHFFPRNESPLKLQAPRPVPF
ncbi:hypothetical protein CISG_06523 [Coccidioides immitis RMSCC 3703]|uniref:Uncharacterized protein n=1 Tax=Coccidioides immitis RMSCC 3703 TaxID=454286 RepID=A0A0J8QYH4_COCIT|nr:hypothetical protein CISG_06523 [Coccidioides immitis RMSCC 3703]